MRQAKAGRRQAKVYVKPIDDEAFKAELSTGSSKGMNGSSDLACDAGTNGRQRWAQPCVGDAPGASCPCGACSRWPTSSPGRLSRHASRGRKGGLSRDRAPRSSDRTVGCTWSRWPGRLLWSGRRRSASRSLASFPTRSHSRKCSSPLPGEASQFSDFLKGALRRWQETDDSDRRAPAMVIPSSSRLPAGPAPRRAAAFGPDADPQVSIGSKRPTAPEEVA